MGMEIQNQNNNFQDSNIDIGQNFNNVQIVNQVNNFTLPKDPIDKFIHYDFNDSYLLFISMLLLIIPLASTFYVNKLNMYAILLVFTLIVILFFSRLIHIMKSLDVFPMYFIYNGKYIYFTNIESINKIGFYVKIKYHQTSNDYPQRITFYKESDLLKFIEIFNKSKNLT